MPRKKSDNPTKSVPKDQGAGADKSAERTDWDRKLSEARAKRAEVLSARAQSKTSLDAPLEDTKPAVDRKPNLKWARLPKKAPASPAVDLPEATAGEAARVKFSLTGAHAMKALFVFCGAVGFGIGTVVGFGILIGMGPSSSTQSQAVFDASTTAKAIETPVQAVPEKTGEVAANIQSTDVTGFPVEAIEETPLTSVFSISPEVAIGNVESEAEVPPAQAEQVATAVRAPEFTPALPDMLDKDFGFFTEPDDETSLPSISNVQYMRDDLPELDAVYLRSLPEVSELALASIPAVETGDPEPKFFMHAPDGLSDAQVRRYVAQLADKGVQISKIGREGFRVSTTHLRYYSPETAAVATAVAKDLGIPARDFSENARNPGRIEVWVAGSPKPVESEQETSKGVFYWLGEGRREER